MRERRRDVAPTDGEHRQLARRGGALVLLGREQYVRPPARQVDLEQLGGAVARGDHVADLRVDDDLGLLCVDDRAVREAVMRGARVGRELGRDVASLVARADVPAGLEVSHPHDSQTARQRDLDEQVEPAGVVERRVQDDLLDASDTQPLALDERDDGREIERHGLVGGEREWLAGQMPLERAVHGGAVPTRGIQAARLLSGGQHLVGHGLVARRRREQGPQVRAQRQTLDDPPLSPDRQSVRRPEAAQ